MGDGFVILLSVFFQNTFFSPLLYLYKSRVAVVDSNALSFRFLFLSLSGKIKILWIET